jgi:hypothetical protein
VTWWEVSTRLCCSCFRKPPASLLRAAACLLRAGRGLLLNTNLNARCARQIFLGVLRVGVPFGLRGSVAWLPVLGLSAVVGSPLLHTHHTTTTTASTQPLPPTPTLQLRIRDQPLLDLASLGAVQCAMPCIDSPCTALSHTLFAQRLRALVGFR